MGKFSIVETLESRQLLNVDLDPGFGTHGVLNLGNGGISARATTSDGRILVAGAMQLNLPSLSDTAVTRPFVMRLLSDGSADPSFGGEANGQPQGTPDGTVVLVNSHAVRHISDVAGLSDGSVLISGDARIGAAFVPSVAKLDANGTTDTNFGGSAHSAADAPAGSALFHADNDTSLESQNQFHHLAVGADGRIAVGGVRETGDVEDVVVFNANGSLDQSFGTNGVFGQSTSDNGTTFHSFGPMTFTEDGTLIVSQYTTLGGANPSAALLSLFALQADGTLAPIDGPVLDSVDGHGEDSFLSITQLKTLSDGSYLALADQANDLVVYHLQSDLTIDSGYAGGQGKAVVPLPSDGIVLSSSLALMPDERFYVAAVDESLNTGTEYLTRFLPDGAIDPAFGTGIVYSHAISSQGGDPIFDLVAPANDDAIVIDATAEPNDSFSVLQLAARKALGGDRIALTGNGTLLVAGSSSGDVVSLRIRKSDGRLVAGVNGTAKSFNPAVIKRISIYSYGGRDSVTIAAGVRGVFADGGPDKDTLTGGDGNDILLGNTGNDMIFGGLGNDSLIGGGGNDYLFGDKGNDTLAGNGGHDTLSGAAGNDLLFGGPGAADTIYGGTGNDLAAQDFADTYHDVETRV